MGIFSREVRTPGGGEKKRKGTKRKINKRRSKETCDEDGEIIGVWI